jgi:diacylglycerol kinase (ATP)
MTERIGVLVNPTAGRGKALMDSAKTFERLQEKAKGYEINDLSGDNVEESIANAKKAISEGNLAALIVVGGDGMVNLGFNAVAGTKVPLGIVPCGSGNDYVRSLQIPVNQVSRVVDGICMGLKYKTTYDVDAGRVQSIDSDQNLDGKIDTWFASILAAGVDADINLRANESKLPGGSLRYAAASVIELSRLAMHHYRVNFKGFPSYNYDSSGILSKSNLETVLADTDEKEYVWDKRGSMVSIANSKYYGGGIKMAPTALIDDGYFELILAEQLSRAGALKLFPATYSGNHVFNKNLKVYRTKKVFLATDDEEGEQPIAMADGELMGNFPLMVECYKGAVSILMHPSAHRKFMQKREDILESM